MKMSKNKIAIAISLFLMLTMAISLIALPTANAHDPPWSVPSYAFINVAPNPAGLGQEVTIGMWLQLIPPTASGATGDRWKGYKVTVTRPDGHTDILGPFTSDDTGGTFTRYTPPTVGEYSFVFEFPGQTITGENNANPFNVYIGDYFEPATSETAHLLVQDEAIPPIPTVPLPTQYWTRPIQSGNGQWYTISGNWLGLGAHPFANTGRYDASNSYNAYSEAPLAPHIIWTKPVAFGGLTGGEFGGSDTSNFYSTSQYEPKWAPIIMNGIMYYTDYPVSSTNPTGWSAVNLKTGETIWTNNADNLGGGNPEQTALTSSGIVTVLRCGQLLNMFNPNQYGNIAYLWSTGTPDGIVSSGTTYNLFDAMTGTYILSIVNGTSLYLTEDDVGALIGYFVDNSNASAPTLNLWNSTQAILYPDSQYIPGVTIPSWSWRPRQNGVIDFARGIVWTKPLPIELDGAPFGDTLSFGFPSPARLAINSVADDVVLMTAVSDRFFNTGWAIDAGYDAITGDQLWIANRTLTAFTRDSITQAGDGNYYYLQSSEGKIRAYDLQTGRLVWGPTQLEGDNGEWIVPNPYNSIGGYNTVLADDVLYIMGFGGDVWAIDASNGEQLWYTSTNVLIGEAGSDTPYGIWPLWVFSGGSVSGNGVYLLNVGHEYSPPLFRGAQQLALNTTNGELIWNIMGFDVTNAATIVDGVVTVLNAYDNQLYSYAKGPSALTVTAPAVGVTTATPITITGTILDISAGSKQEAQAANFPYGLPCVSDESMRSWMEYVYMQQPCPANITGVPVTLSVLDSNGNQYDIGTTTSDATGAYGLTWTPPISGDFVVYATFGGTQSYYESYATTYLYAGEAPAATAEPTPMPASAADLYFLPMSIGTIVAIIAIGIVLILMLRKR
jgi:hypothetical protein